MTACQKTEFDTEPSPPQPVEDEYLVSYEQALNTLDDIRSSIYPSTKGKKVENEIKNSRIHKINRPGIKDKDKKSAFFHIVNFKNNGGFSIISGDSRASSVYAVADSGNFEEEDLATNPGLQIFMANAENYFEQEVRSASLGDGDGEGADPNLPMKRPENGGGGGGANYDVVYGDWVTYSQVGTIIPVQWGQKGPFNNKIRQVYNENYPVGCVATAVATVMAYHGYPSSYSGYTFNWHAMVKDNYNSNIADLMYLLGTTGHLNMQYGLIESGAYIFDMPRTFRKFGYSEGSSHQSYDLNTVMQSLLKQSPVLISGNGDVEYFLFWGTPVKGHTWVIDQVKKMYRNVYDNRLGNTTLNHVEYRDLVHCNWGWGGTSNGYFLSGVFDTDQKIIGDNTSNPSRRLCYPYNIEILPFVHR